LCRSRNGEFIALNEGQRRMFRLRELNFILCAGNPQKHRLVHIFNGQISPHLKEY
jgi:hypothetical protein